jgi:hypothetical protein
MARPAPNNPQDGNGYGDDDDEPEGERVMPSAPKRGAPPQKPIAAKPRQWRGESPPDARTDAAWNDNDAEPVAMDYDAAPVPSGEPAPLFPQSRPDKSERAPFAPPAAPAAKGPAIAGDEGYAPEPNLTAEQPAPETVAPKVRRAAPARDYDWAGAIYLALMAILVACLSAAVVLFLF